MVSYGIIVLTHYLRKHFFPLRVLLLFQAIALPPVGETEQYMYIKVDPLSSGAFQCRNRD